MELPTSGGLATASLHGCLVKPSHYALRRPAPSPLPRTKLLLYFNVGRLLTLKRNLADSQRLQKQQEEPGVETPPTNPASQCPRSNHYALRSQHVGQLTRGGQPPQRSGIQKKSPREFLPWVIQVCFHAQAFKKYSSSVLLRKLPVPLRVFAKAAPRNLTRGVTHLSLPSNPTLYS